MAQIVLALDQGTTSSRAILFNAAGEILASTSAAFPCLYPQSGWVEQRPEEIWESQRQTIFAVLEKAKLPLRDVTAIGITNQRETTIAWNKDTGEVLHNAIVWQCRRTANFCDQLKLEGFDQTIKQKTGLVTDAYFSGTKMRWILKEIPEARRLADQGKLAFGTVDSWLIWKLTGGKVHAIDASNASRTLVYNIFEGHWDEEILAHFEIPLHCLPEVKPSSGVIGYTDASQFGASIPIAGVAGDQQASLFGQACFDPGMVKNTFGTGCFMLVNTGHNPIVSSHGMLTTIAWKLGHEVTYALEGAVFIGGALMQWLRDGMSLFQDARETEAMAYAVPDSGGVYIVPAFVGLGAPYWDPYARGTMIGLTRNTNKNHLVRAGLEAIAYQVFDLLKSMESDIGSHIKTLRVDGGAVANNFLCQFQADILGLEVSRPRVIETTAMGAAFLAGLATGVWSSQKSIQAMWREERQFTPQMKDSDVSNAIQGWHRAVERSRRWLNP